MKKFRDYIAEGGLWDNIHKKRKRIKNGSNEKMRKPGSKGAPTAQDFKDAAESVDEGKIGKAIGSVIGGTAGALGGALAGGTAGGLVAPGVGNMVGFAGGGVAGRSVGANLGGRIGDAITGDGKRGERAVNLVGKGIKGTGKLALKGVKKLVTPPPHPVPHNIVHPAYGKVIPGVNGGSSHLAGVDGQRTNITTTNPKFKFHQNNVRSIGNEKIAQYLTRGKNQK
jgi:hypothetical protein